MKWIEFVERVCAILVALTVLIGFVRSEIRRLRKRRKGAGSHSKKPGS